MSGPVRTAWVIGASSGIGRELAKSLAAAGVTVTVSARRAAALESLRAECVEGVEGKAVSLPLDVADPDAVAGAVAAMERDGGLPDVAIVCSGAYEPAEADDLDPRLFADIMNVNYLGVVNVVSALLPAYLARGRGHIAAVASVAGYRGLPLASAYGPSKAAVINLFESLQPELAVRGVRLQLINPGFVETPMTAKNRFAMPFLISPERAAREIHRGLMSRRFEVTFPKRFTWFLKLTRLLPYALYFPLIGALTGARRRAAEKRL